MLSCHDLLVANDVARAKVAEGNQTRRTGVSAEEGRFDPAECFDKVWGTINEEFWDQNFNGVDWEDANKRYRLRALAAKDHELFAGIVNQMLAELKTSHTHYYTKWEPAYYGLQAAFGHRRLKTENETSFPPPLDGCRFPVPQQGKHRLVRKGWPAKSEPVNGAYRLMPSRRELRVYSHNIQPDNGDDLPGAQRYEYQPNGEERILIVESIF